MEGLIKDGQNMALHYFLSAYGDGRKRRTGEMRRHLFACGFDGCWPEWAEENHSLTESEAQLWIKHLISLEPKDPVQSGWRDIESAPKDGSWIIAVVSGVVMTICWESIPDDNDYYGWCSAGSSYGGTLCELHNSIEGTPILWMPLPPSPDLKNVE